MALPVDAKVQVRYWLTTPSSQCILDLWYVVTSGAGNPLIAQDLADLRDYMADFGTAGQPGYALKQVMATNVTISRIDTQMIYPGRSAFVTGSYAQPGNFGADADTDNIAAVLTMRTAFSGRSQVANKHIGPLPKTAYNNGVLTAGYIAKLALLGTALIASVNLASPLTLRPIVNHPGATYDVTTNTSSSGRVGTMRRRTVRVGI